MSADKSSEERAVRDSEPTTSTAPPEGSFHHVVAAILVDADKILLVHRGPFRDWAPDTWDVPGGHIESGETAPEAVRREVREELGVKVAARSLTPSAHLSGPTWEVTYFKIESWSGEISNAAPHEHSELRWMTLAEMSDLHLADPEILPVLVAALA